MDTTVLARCEYKYVLAPEMADRFRAAIRPYCELDEHGAENPGGFYTVNSLYFDDDRYRLYWDTVHDAPLRYKVRVRNYGRSGAEGVKFEVKRRVQDVIVKTSAWLPPEGWPEWISPRGRKDPSGLSGANRDALEYFIASMRRSAARPKMLVRYERQAFRSVIDDYVRITFDRHMVYQPVARCDLAGRRDRWTAMDDAESMGSFGSHLLLELKFARSVPVWLVGIVRRMGLVRQGYSKYGCAVRRGLMARNAGWDLVIPPHLGGPRLEAAWSF